MSGMHCMYFNMGGCERENVLKNFILERFFHWNSMYDAPFVGLL